MLFRKKKKEIGSVHEKLSIVLMRELKYVFYLLLSFL
jgi:hypothetical protein